MGEIVGKGVGEYVSVELVLVAAVGDVVLFELIVGEDDVALMVGEDVSVGPSFQGLGAATGASVEGARVGEDDDVVSLSPPKSI